MAKRDLYKVLGVSKSATEQEIRKAYRELARKDHPDRNPGDKAAEERFKEASYASDILLNKGKRSLYDEFGEMGLREGFDADTFRRYQQRGGPGGPQTFEGIGSIEDLLGRIAGAGAGGAGPAGWGGGLNDLFGDDVQTIFGRGGERRGARGKGREVLADVAVSFLEALRGAERELTLQVPGEAPRTLKVRIPAGVRDQGKVRLRGQGHAGGDLVLRVQVGEHPFFSRSEDDLLLNLPVTVGEAMEGAKVQVPTLDGSVSLQIPKGVRSGAKLRLRGKGVRRGQTTGDLLVVVQVVVPPSGPELKDAMDALEKAYPESVRKDLAL